MPIGALIHIAVPPAYREPVKIAVKNAGTFVFSPGAFGADFQPAPIPPAFPSEGKSGVRGCFAVGHANDVARSWMGVKMLRGLLVIVSKLVAAGWVVVPVVEPVERIP